MVLSNISYRFYDLLKMCLLLQISTSQFGFQSLVCYILILFSVFVIKGFVKSKTFSLFICRYPFIHLYIYIHSAFSVVLFFCTTLTSLSLCSTICFCLSYFCLCFITPSLFVNCNTGSFTNIIYFLKLYITICIIIILYKLVLDFQFFCYKKNRYIFVY